MGNWVASFSEQWKNEKADNCNIYMKFRRNGSFLGISGYEGIPQNLVLNIFGWIVLYILFIILRKKAWNYGRLAVMQKEEIKWTDMFYGGYQSDTSIGSDAGINSTMRQPVVVASAISISPEGAATIPQIHPTSVSQSPDGRRGSSPDDARSSLPGRDTDNNNGKNDKNEGGDGLGNSDSSEHKIQQFSEIRDSGYFSWIKIVLNLKDEQYRDKCGQDCVFYLSFQRHLILLALIITLFSLIVILPINMKHTFKDKEKPEFSDTTIINLEKETNYLWAHVLLSISFLFISIAIMRNYSKRLQYIEDEESYISRTVMIIGLKKKSCREDMLRAHFMESYPSTEITEVSFAYDISKLKSLEFKKLSACSAKIYFTELHQRQLLRSSSVANVPKVERPQMRPYVCGIMGFLCKYCDKCKETDAIEYYTEKEKKLIEEVEKERQDAVKNPLGIAFVTFSDIESAERFVEDYAFSARIFLQTPVSKFSKELNSGRWIVKYAAPPEDICWENLNLDFKMWYIKFLIVNIILAILVVIFTTPVYLFTMLPVPKPKTGEKNKQSAQLASVILDTMPTLMIWILGNLLIYIVYRSDSIVGYWTKTARSKSEMVKIFVFLTFMVIVLPSLGVSSFSYFLNSSSKSGSLSWSCIFYKENGALFVNYICTSSLVGTAAELMRLPELFTYTIKLSFAKSKAEIAAIRKSVLWDFQIGTSYAWTMLHFAIFTCFSVIYPLVTPFGLIYLCLKHWTDRYNIYFAYAPCKVDKGVHGTAVNFVIICMFMLQVNLLAYVHFHLGANTNIAQSKGANSTELAEVRALQVFSLLGFSITVALFLGQLCFNVCADFSPIRHFKSISQAEGEGEEGPDKRRSVTRVNEATTSTADIPSFGIVAARRSTAPRHDAQTSTINPHIHKVHGHGHNRSDSIGSGHSSGKPYGLYIPALLRPEFIRLAGGRRTGSTRSKSSSTHSKLRVTV